MYSRNHSLKLLDKYFPGCFYGPNRDGPCEWLGSKRDLERLDAMEELVYYTNKFQHPRTTTVLSETSDSKGEHGGLTVRRDQSVQLKRRKRVITREERGAFPARRVAADRPRAPNINLS